MAPHAAQLQPPASCSSNNEPHDSYLQPQHARGPLSHLIGVHSTETSLLQRKKFGLRGCSPNACPWSTGHTYAPSPRFHKAFLNPLRREVSLSPFLLFFFFPSRPSTGSRAGTQRPPPRTHLHAERAPPPPTAAQGPARTRAVTPARACGAPPAAHLEDVLVDGGPELQQRLLVELSTVDDPHLLKESGLAALPGAQQQDFDQAPHGPPLPGQHRVDLPAPPPRLPLRIAAPLLALPPRLLSARGLGRQQAAAEGAHHAGHGGRATGALTTPPRPRAAPPASGGGRRDAGTRQEEEQPGAKGRDRPFPLARRRRREAAGCGRPGGGVAAGRGPQALPGEEAPPPGSGLREEPRGRGAEGGCPRAPGPGFSRRRPPPVPLRRDGAGARRSPRPPQSRSAAATALRKEVPARPHPPAGSAFDWVSVVSLKTPRIPLDKSP